MPDTAPSSPTGNVIFGGDQTLSEAERNMPTKQIGIDAFDGEFLESNFDDGNDPFEGENEDGEMQEYEDDSLEGIPDPWSHDKLPVVHQIAMGEATANSLGDSYISQANEDHMCWSPSKAQRSIMLAVDLSQNSLEDLDTLGPTFLRFLNASYNPLSSLGGLFHSCRNTLVAIDISGVKVNQIEDCWPVLETLPKLSHLVAKDCDIDSRQCQKLSTDNPLVNILFADLSGNKIANKNLEDLSLAFENVEHLVVTGNPAAEKGVGPFQSHFPGCKIVI